MLKSNQSDFNPILRLSVQFKQSCAASFRLITQKQITPLRLMLLLGFTGISWIASSSIAPQIAQAYTARVNISLSRQLSESYESFLRRAEAVARAATQRSFDADILVTDVSVTVVGQNQGAIAPILLLEVSRQSWRSRPAAQEWTTYFPDTQSLLGFDEPALDSEIESPGGQPPPPPGVPAAVPQPTGPTTIDIPGAPIRIIPTSPTNQAPNAPTGTPQPAASPPSIPDIPGAPIRRIPNPNAAPAPSAPTTQPAGQ